MTCKFIPLLFIFIGISLHGQDYKDRLVELQNKTDIYFYTNKDSTYHYYNKIDELALKNKDYITIIDKLNEVCFAAGYYYDIQKIKTSIDRLDILLSQNSKLLDTLQDKGFYQKNYLLYNKGNYFHKLEDFDQAEIYFDELIKNITTKSNYQNITDDIAFLSTCYSFIAQINTLQNRFSIAAEYYNKNIRLFKKHMPNDITGLHKVYNLYASSLYDEKRYVEAKKYWKLTLEFSENNYDVSNRNSIITTCLLLSNLHKDAKQIDSANYYLNKIKKYKIEKDPFSDRYLYSKGDVLLQEKKFDKALILYKKALAISSKNDQPRVQKKIADLYFEKGELESALKNYQLSLQGLSINFTSKDISKNPEPNLISQKQLFLKILGAKTKTLNKKKYYNITLQTVDTSLKTLDILKPNYRNQADKLNLIEDSFPIFESGIEACYQLYLKDNDEKFLDKIFSYSEKSKAVLLLDALLNSRATKFANIPENLLKKENHLKSTIAYIKKQVETASKTSTNLEDELFKLNKEHTDLIKKFETNYASYYNLRYNTAVVPISTVQENLKRNEIVVSYFYGIQFIYALAITNTSKKVLRIPVTASLEKNIGDVHNMLSSNTSNLNDLNRKSFHLYETILAPLLKGTGEKKLLIIPDGILNYIAFDALNNQKKGVEYLIEKYTVSSINSLTLLNQLNKKKSNKNSLLAFAPIFKGKPVQGYELRSGLAPLPNNTREISTILEYFKGSPFINNQASLSNFNAQVSSHNMIHLATHAVFDDTSPEYSYLAFTPETNKDYVLYVSDIYNLELNADLITLSACETGIGKLRKGEGALSLSRAFFYSGAQSLVHTLWNAVDQSSSDIMDNFYKNLSDGETKDVALQKAKLAYFNKYQETSLTHPYYWSSFVIQGNTDSLSTTPNHWFFIVIGIILAIVIYSFRKRLLQFFK